VWAVPAGWRRGGDPNPVPLPFSACAAVGVEFDPAVDGATPARMLGKALEARRAAVG
jgi:hypothetical protein